MFAALFLPNFELQAALRFRPDWDAESQKAIAVVDGDPGVVVDLSVEAESQGVGLGLTSSQALARSPGLILLARTGDQEKAVSEILCELACSLSQNVEQTAPECCTLDLSCAQVPDFERWAMDAVKLAGGLHLRTQVGVAPNPDLALLAARSAAPIRLVEDSDQFLFQQPVAALSPAPASVPILRDWGIHTIQDLARLPQDGVVARLGEEGRRLWNRAHGRGQRLLNLVRAREVFCETFDFEREIETLEPLLFIIRRFLEQLVQRLDLTYRVAAKMTLVLPLSDGRSHECRFAIPAPTSDLDVLFRIIDTHLDQLKLAHGPTGASLMILPSSPHRQQFGLFENTLRDPNRFSETLARLTALLGTDRVGFLASSNTHRPDSYELKPPDLSSMEERQEEPRQVVVGLPLHRYRPPFPAQVSLKNQQPGYVVSDQAHGRIKAALGPHRCSGDWWDEKPWAVEEWIIETTDGLYLLSRRNAQWLVAGCYEEHATLR